MDPTVQGILATGAVTGALSILGFGVKWLGSKLDRQDLRRAEIAAEQKARDEAARVLAESTNHLANSVNTAITKSRDEGLLVISGLRATIEELRLSAARMVPAVSAAPIDARPAPLAAMVAPAAPVAVTIEQPKDKPVPVEPVDQK